MKIQGTGKMDFKDAITMLKVFGWAEIIFAILFLILDVASWGLGSEGMTSKFFIDVFILIAGIGTVVTTKAVENYKDK